VACGILSNGQGLLAGAPFNLSGSVDESIMSLKGRVFPKDEGPRIPTHPQPPEIRYLVLCTFWITLSEVSSYVPLPSSFAVSFSFLCRNYGESKKKQEQSHLISILHQPTLCDSCHLLLALVMPIFCRPVAIHNDE